MPRSKLDPEAAPPLVVISGEAFAHLSEAEFAAAQKRAGQAVMAELGLGAGDIRSVRAYNMLPRTEGYRQPTIAQRLGRALRHMRVLARLKQSEVATERGTTQSAIAEEEAGKTKTAPRLDTLARSAGITKKRLLVAFADPTTEYLAAEPPVAYFPSAIRITLERPDPDTIRRREPTAFDLSLREHLLNREDAYTNRRQGEAITAQS